MKHRVKRLGGNSGKRKDQVSAGVYDGRYRERVVTDKKKKENRNWARKNK